MTWYVDLSASSDGSGTKASPFNLLSSAKAVASKSGDEILIKRGSTAVLSALSFSRFNSLTIGDYGSGSKPVIDNYTEISSAGAWTEVDTGDGDTASPGSHFWRTEFATSSTLVFVAFGTPGAAGVGLRRKHWVNEGYPTNDDTLAAEGEWDYLPSGTIVGQTSPYLYVYSVGNPATTIGSIYWSTQGDSPITLDACNDVLVENLAAGNCGCLVRVRNSLVLDSKNIELSNLEGAHVGNLVFLGFANTGRYGTNIHVHHCDTTLSQHGAYRVNENVRDLLIEYNSADEMGASSSEGGIYCTGTSPSNIRNIIRCNTLSGMHFGRYWSHDGGAIYLDNGSAGFLIYRNKIANSYIGLKDHSSASLNNPNWWVSNITDDCMVGAESSNTQQDPGHKSYFNGNAFMRCGNTLHVDAALDDNVRGAFRFLTSGAADLMYAHNNVCDIDGTNTAYGMILDTVGAGTYTEDNNSFYGHSGNPVVNRAETLQTPGTNDITTDNGVNTTNYAPGENLKGAGVRVVGEPLLPDYNGNPFLPYRTIGAVQDQYTKITSGGIAVNL